MGFATSAGLEGRGHTKDTITNKRDQLASSDTLPEDNKERWGLANCQVRRSVPETVSREPWRTSNPSYGRERRADGFVR